MSDFKISTVPMEAPQKDLGADRLEKIAKSGDRAKLEKAAKEFEGVFVSIVMKSMRDTIQDSDVFGDSSKTKMFQSMLDEQYSNQIASQRGLHIADAIVRQFSKDLPKEVKE